MFHNKCKEKEAGLNAKILERENTIANLENALKSAEKEKELAVEELHKAEDLYESCRLALKGMISATDLLLSEQPHEVKNYFSHAKNYDQLPKIHFEVEFVYGREGLRSFYRNGLNKFGVFFNAGLGKVFQLGDLSVSTKGRSREVIVEAKTGLPFYEAVDVFLEFLHVGLKLRKMELVDQDRSRRIAKFRIVDLL